MSAVTGLEVAWAAAGLVLGVRWWRERGALQASRRTQAVPAGARFGQLREDRSRARLLAMRLAYAFGATLVSLGLLLDAAALLAGGALLVNVGTLYRYLAMALDLHLLDVPLVPRPERSPGRAAHLAGARRLQPAG